MSRNTSRQPVSGASIDLDTVRATLAYMATDMRRAAGCERIAAALETAMSEIDDVSAKRLPSREAALPGTFRFLPWSPRA